jgi:hypothetical protein
MSYIWRLPCLLTVIQNRAYAVSQLTDLHQKLSKAQGAVQNTRAQAPTLPADEKAAASGKGKEAEKKKPEENQLAKSVKDRYSYLLSHRRSTLTGDPQHEDCR